MLKSDFAAADNKITLCEIKRESDKIAWATLRETRDLFRRIADGGSPRDAIGALTPALDEQVEKLEKEAENNSFGQAV